MDNIMKQYSGSVLRHFIKTLVLISGLIAFSAQAAETLYYFHNDHLGTPQVMTDETQAVVWHANYRPFGETVITTATIENNLRFPGQYFDVESGLHYNYFRYYDPGTGRYVSSDPIGLEGGLNTFAYTMWNPVNYIDPDGKSPVHIGLGIGGAIIGGGIAWYNDQPIWAGAAAGGIAGLTAGATLGLSAGISLVANTGVSAVVSGLQSAVNQSNDQCSSEIDWPSVIHDGIRGGVIGALSFGLGAGSGATIAILGGGRHSATMGLSIQTGYSVAGQW